MADDTQSMAGDSSYTSADTGSIPPDIKRILNDGMPLNAQRSSLGVGLTQSFE